MRQAIATPLSLRLREPYTARRPTRSPLRGPQNQLVVGLDDVDRSVDALFDVEGEVVALHDLITGHRPVDQRELHAGSLAEHPYAGVRVEPPRGLVRAPQDLYRPVGELDQVGCLASCSGSILPRVLPTMSDRKQRPMSVPLWLPTSASSEGASAPPGPSGLSRHAVRRGASGRTCSPNGEPSGRASAPSS